MIDIIAIVISVISLVLAYRAYSLGKQRLSIQVEQHSISKGDIEAKQKPKLQIENETFLSSWQMQVKEERCAVDEITLFYSSQLTNKGDSTVEIESVVIEIGSTKSPLSDPNTGLAMLVLSSFYLSSGESISLEKTIEASAIQMTRMFFENFDGVLVYTLVFKYSGYAGHRITEKREIYRMNNQGGIVSKGNYNAHEVIPRSYLLPAT